MGPQARARRRRREGAARPGMSEGLSRGHGPGTAPVPRVHERRPRPVLRDPRAGRRAGARARAAGPGLRVLAPRRAPLRRERARRSRTGSASAGSTRARAVALAAELEAGRLPLDHLRGRTALDARAAGCRDPRPPRARPDAASTTYVTSRRRRSSSPTAGARPRGCTRTSSSRGASPAATTRSRRRRAGSWRS